MPADASDLLRNWDRNDPSTAPVGSLIGSLGMTVTAAGPDVTSVTWGDDATSGSAGIYAIAAETTCSVGGATWWGDRGQCVGMSNHTTVFDPDAAGPFTARATPVDRGTVQQLWRCEITDGAGRLCGSSEVLLANLS